MRTKEEILAEMYAHANSTEEWDRDMFGLTVQEVLEYGFVPTEVPDHLRIRIVGDTIEGASIALPTSFVPVRGENRWDVEVLHVLDAETDDERHQYGCFIDALERAVRTAAEAAGSPEVRHLWKWNRPDGDRFGLVYSLLVKDEGLDAAFWKASTFVRPTLQEALDRTPEAAGPETSAARHAGHVDP